MGDGRGVTRTSAHSCQVSVKPIQNFEYKLIKFMADYKCHKRSKLEILQFLGGLYDGLAFTPSTGLMRLHFRSRSLPPESPPPH